MNRKNLENINLDKLYSLKSGYLDRDLSFFNIFGSQTIIINSNSITNGMIFADRIAKLIYIKNSPR